MCNSHSFVLVFYQRACEEALYGLQFFSARSSAGDNMTLKRSTSVHQGKLDASGNEPSLSSSSSTGGILTQNHLSMTAS